RRLSASIARATYDIAWLTFRKQNRCSVISHKYHSNAAFLSYYRGSARKLPGTRSKAPQPNWRAVNWSANPVDYMQRTSRSRLLALGFCAILPSFLKRPLYRLCFGYNIGKRVQIGLSIID